MLLMLCVGVISPKLSVRILDIVSGQWISTRWWHLENFSKKFDIENFFWFLNWFTDWYDWLIDWLIDSLVGWLVGWLLTYFMDDDPWLGDLEISENFRLTKFCEFFSWLVDVWFNWISDWVIDWSTDWLVAWLYHLEYG